MSASEESQASPMRVFISYSHDSREHSDQFEELPAQGWPLWCARQILDAGYVLLICTEIYRKRFLGLEEFGNGLGVKWEAKIIQNILYYEEINTGFIPVLFNDSDSHWVPETVREASSYLIPASIVDSPAYVELRQRLTGGNRFPPLGIPLRAEAYRQRGWTTRFGVSIPAEVLSVEKDTDEATVLPLIYYPLINSG
jgi:hypothetical protein